MAQPTSQRFQLIVRLLTTALMAAPLGGCSPEKPVPIHTELEYSLQQAQAQRHLAIRPIPRFNPYEIDLELARLGRDLFVDPRFSSNNQISCASCHHLDGYGAEPLVVSIGVQGQGHRNSPTVFNSGFNPMQFWDGRALSLEQQINGPLHNPLEMDSDWPQVIGKLRADADLVERFQTLLGQPINANSIAYAISYFEQQLQTPDSNFDRYLRGEAQLSVQAKAGWQQFTDIGCIQCHQGINVGGNLLQTFGLTYRDHLDSSDLGLAELTLKDQDRMVFRVPSLRNVTQTAPYFHNGSVHELSQAVEIMALSQLGKKLTQQELSELLAFLNSLTAPPPPILSLLDETETD
ncbi:cytochrome c peroxidase [Ferrimonas senticii]|uniref:cytochrome c peroxidase n=1 Tax=Ferrimonas senticii TaxID=394566 RepID=UPI0004150E97|nr:cytochrome c peroxidase [Ferrimonas senticii]